MQYSNTNWEIRHGMLYYVALLRQDSNTNRSVRTPFHTLSKNFPDLERVNSGLLGPTQASIATLLEESPLLNHYGNSVSGIGGRHRYYTVARLTSTAECIER